MFIAFITWLCRGTSYVTYMHAHLPKDITLENYQPLNTLMVKSYF